VEIDILYTKAGRKRGEWANDSKILTWRVRETNFSRERLNWKGLWEPGREAKLGQGPKTNLGEQKRGYLRVP